VVRQQPREERRNRACPSWADPPSRAAPVAVRRRHRAGKKNCGLRIADCEFIED
jgi:hypothetical protein